MVNILSATYGTESESRDVTVLVRELSLDGTFYVGNAMGDPFPNRRKSLRVRYECSSSEYEDVVPEHGMFVARPLLGDGLKGICQGEFRILSAKFGADAWADFTEEARVACSGPFDVFRVSDDNGNNPFPDPEPFVRKYYVFRFAYRGREFVHVAREPDTHFKLLRPTFSVIIPTWNRCEFLPRCIESVAGQDFVRGADGSPRHGEVEIVVADDGSSDDTREVMSGLCRKYPWLVYLRLPRTGCVGLVRNRAIGLSTGRIVAFLDSDDRYYPCHLSEVYERFMGTDAMMVRTWHEFCRLAKMEDGHIEERKELDFKFRLFNEWGMYTSCIAVRRELLDRMSLEKSWMDSFPMPSRQSGEDHAFFSSAVRAMDSMGIGQQVVDKCTVLYGLIAGGNNISYVDGRVAANYRDAPM